MTTKLARQLARRFDSIKLPGNLPRSKTFNKVWNEFIEGRALMYWNSKTGELRFGVRKKK